MTEEEKRKHRCCFSGQRPEKLDAEPDVVKDWLKTQIRDAISSGFTTFITGCAMGVDIWAGQIVISIRDAEKKGKGTSDIKLIAATPWHGFANRWSQDWQQQYNALLKAADLVVPVSRKYWNDVFQKRNEWIVDHSNRVIAYYNGAPGGTKNIIEYAQKQSVEVISNDPVYVPAAERRKKSDAEKILYPENLLRDIGMDVLFENGEYTTLTPDQLEGLKAAIATILPREQEMLRLRYEEHHTMQEIGDAFELSRTRAQQIVSKGVRKLRHPSRLLYIKEGYAKTELSQKLYAATEIKRELYHAKKRYPMMNEEDTVKFVFQAMLGVGHLVNDEEMARERLKAEIADLDGIESDESLTEKLSPQWLRLNLREAQKEGLSEQDLAFYFTESAKMKGLSFTRQNVYNFCVKLDGSDTMKKAAERVLDENYLPSHSEKYREAYHPAYRVLYKDFRKFRRDEE